ncbi:hypothetical protein FRB99_002176 [Tulasnella sp. 403]|nr:hypothetical protein FRB99_002176 [Tulasnella sp. 403]
MLEADLEALRATHARTTQDLKEIEDHLEETAQQLVREHEALEDALARLNSFQGHTTDDAVSAAKLTEMEEEVERMRVEKERAEQAEKLMESALEDAEKAALAFEQEKASLNVRIAVLEREKNDLEILLTEARAGQANHTTHSISGKSRGSEDDEQISLFHHDEVISKLERELEEAQREIGRLRFRIADSPAREALQNVKDVQIKLLEEQKKELVEQVNALRRILGEHVSIWEADASGLGQATPARPGSRKTSGQYTPARSMSMRASRTAAHGAIKDMSWGSHVSPLGSGIHSILPPLQHEASELMQQLQAANDRLDAKFEELQRNGLQGVSLTKQLDDAREKGVALQSEVERLLRREERLLKRLERCRCLKCGRRFDASGLASWAKSGNQRLGLATDPATDSSLTINTSSKSTTAIKATLANTNAELATLKAQRDLLQNERQTLEDQARKLNLDVERANSKAQRAAEKVEALRHEKDEGDRLREHLQSERDAAKKLAKEFEEDLVKDRLRLQELESQRSKLAHDMNVISAKLKQKDVEMANVLAQLEKAKQRSRDLEEQLKGTVQPPLGCRVVLTHHALVIDHSAVGHKSRHLEQKVVDNQNVIQQLRQDRENLHQDTEKLKRKLDQVSKDAENLRKHLRVAQSEHENRRHQQEIHLGELEDYHNDDGRAQPGVKRHDGELTDLRAEVSRLKKEVMRFAQDLKELRQERDALLGRRDDDKAAAERAATIAQSRERALKERLAEVERRANGLEETWSGHVCASEQSIQAVKAQHRNECKGLFVQIHYMKDRVRREATMRSDLAYQKKYLLDIIAVMEKSEKSILASIARIGFPMPAEPPKRKSLKRYAFMVLFIARVRRESQQWQEKSARKDAVMAALEDVRKRRSITNVVSTVPQ